MDRIISIYGMPIIIDGKKIQKRKHKKKRINKKWAKRYGYRYYSNLENGVSLAINGSLYMNQWTYEQLAKHFFSKLKYSRKDRI